jgi:hypothetical protein
MGTRTISQNTICTFLFLLWWLYNLSTKARPRSIIYTEAIHEIWQQMKQHVKEEDFHGL